MTEDQIAILSAIILGGIASNPNEKVSESSLTRAVQLARAMPAALEANKPIVTYLVEMSAGPGGTVSPLGGFTAKEGDVITVNITPDVGNVATVGGTTPGTLTGNTFVTDPVAASGTVEVSFAAEGAADDAGTRRKR